MPTTVNHSPPTSTCTSGPGARRCRAARAAVAPSTTAGYRSVAALSHVPLRDRARRRWPSRSSRGGVRGDAAGLPGRDPVVAVDVRVGEPADRRHRLDRPDPPDHRHRLRRQRARPRRTGVCPGATVSRFVPSASSVRSQLGPARRRRCRPPTTIAAMPIAMPSADRNDPQRPGPQPGAADPQHVAGRSRAGARPSQRHAPRSPRPARRASRTWRGRLAGDLPVVGDDHDRGAGRVAARAAAP